MRTVVTARVQVVVELDVHLENWSSESTVAQVHREGSEQAIKRLDELCRRYVRLIGTPVVDAIIQKKDR